MRRSEALDAAAARVKILPDLRSVVASANQTEVQDLSQRAARNLDRIKSKDLTIGSWVKRVGGDPKSVYEIMKYRPEYMVYIKSVNTETGKVGSYSDVVSPKSLTKVTKNANYTKQEGLI